MAKLKKTASAIDLTRYALFVSIIIAIVAIIFKFGLLSLGGGIGLDKVSSTEITEIKATQNLDQQVVLYKRLIERVGPEQAQIDLFRSGMPFTGETHLLNHTVGDYLYEKYGPAGLVKCQDYFLSSCYHGFLLHAIGNGGMSQVEKSFAECRKEGPSVYSQCAHAIGHGFLANVGYKNIVEALETCDIAIDTMPEFPAFNCYDGIFMENIWAVHDGEPSPDRWVKPEDPMYPCNDPRIDQKYLLGCWSNQPSLAYQLFKGDIKKVGELCLKVKNTEHQRMCFDGLARQIHPIALGQSGKTFELCNLMPNQKWNDYCVVINAGSSYAVGDRTVPFAICGASGEGARNDCYSRVFGIMSSYRKPKEDLKPYCAQIIQEEYRQRCESMF